MAITRENIEKRINYLEELQHKIVEEKTILWNLLDLYSDKGFREIHELESLLKPEEEETNYASQFTHGQLVELGMIISLFPPNHRDVIHVPISAKGAQGFPFTEHKLGRWVKWLHSEDFIYKHKQAKYSITEKGIKLQEQIQKLGY